MPLTRDQLVEIKKVIREAMTDLVRDEDFLSQLATRVADKVNLPAVEDKVCNLQSENTVLKQKITTLEQKSLQNNLRISGIDEKAGEQATDQVLNVLNGTMGLTLCSGDFDACYRVGSDLNKSAIILKLRDYKNKELIMKNRRKLKNTGVKIAEDMCKPLHDLFMRAITELGYKNVWFFGGFIYAKVGGVRHKILTAADIENVKK